MNPNKALWEKGDFTRIAETMRESGAALVAKLGVTKGLKVLDLGCGDGTTAIPAAKLEQMFKELTSRRILLTREMQEQRMKNFLTVLSPKVMLPTCQCWPIAHST